MSSIFLGGGIYDCLVYIFGIFSRVRMGLTAPFCPLAGMITGQVQQAVAAVPGVTEARVTLLQEQWDPSWIKR